MKHFKRSCKISFIVSLILLVVFVICCKFNPQVMPITANLMRKIVGNNNMLCIEQTIFRTKNWIDIRIYSAKLSLGIEQKHRFSIEPAAMAATSLVSTKVNQSHQTKLKTQPTFSNRSNAGIWIDKGWYRKTFVYPENKLPSIADVVFVPRSKARLRMVCGTIDPTPGGPGRIPDNDRNKVLMAFSGGFQYQHDFGGMIANGKLLRRMKNGAGSIIVFNNNQVKIGKWGRDWKKVTPNMLYVRQCLLLVDNGRFASEVPIHIYVLNGTTYTLRSAIGVTKSGDLLYAAGRNLSAAGLAKSLIVAGAVDALCLDLNYGNVTCGIFDHTTNGKLTIKPLTSRFTTPQKFLYTQSRDFMYLVKS